MGKIHYICTCYIFWEREDIMDQKLFIKLTHHAYAPEYLSSYAYENISQKESNAITNRASGCYLEVPSGRRCRVAKPRVARDHPPCAKPIGRESTGWVRERKPKCRAENVSLMLLASSRYFCELPLSARVLFLCNAE